MSYLKSQRNLLMSGTLMASAALGGCTHLEVSKFDPAAAETRTGIAYFLPFTQFETKATWTVTDCSRKLGVTPKLEAAPKAAPDPEGLYVIDYRSLDAFTKTSAVKVEFYDSGAIKAINASADDKTGDIVGKAVGAIGKIVAFLPGPAALSGELQCSSEVVTALADAASLTGDVERMTQALALKNANLEVLTARLLRSGDASDASDLKNLNDLIGTIAADQIELLGTKNKLAEAQKKLTFTAKSLFPSKSDVTDSEKAILIGEAQLAKWSGQSNALSPTSQKFLVDHAVWLRLTSPAGSLGTSAGVGGDSKDKRAGVRYRIGIPGRLEGIKGDVRPNGTWAPETILADARFASLPVTVMQRGTTFFLPFSSAPFSNGALKATFAENGVMTSAGYEQLRAPGEGAAALLASLADTVVTTGTAVRDAKQSELEKLKDQTELAKAQKELEVAQAALVTAPASPTEEALKVLQADTTIKAAELVNVQTDIALRKARAERDGLSGG